VELRLSGAGEIGISFLRGRVRAVAEAVLDVVMLVMGFDGGLMPRTWVL
jgi:hypothetical protein